METSLPGVLAAGDAVRGSQARQRLRQGVMTLAR
jgi:thioredoxin reductase